MPLLQVTQHSIFQQDNPQPHMVKIVQVFSSLACMFATLVTYQKHVCDTGIHSWCFVISHTNYVEGDSPETYQGLLWLHAMTLIGSDCKMWRLHAILKPQGNKSCRAIILIIYIYCHALNLWYKLHFSQMYPSQCCIFHKYFCIIIIIILMGIILNWKLCTTCLSYFSFRTVNISVLFLYEHYFNVIFYCYQKCNLLTNMLFSCIHFTALQ